MDSIRSWALGLSCAAIIGVVVSALAPSGRLEKSMKTVIAIFVLCMMILPLCKGFTVFSDIDHSLEYNSHEVEDSISTAVVNQIETVTRQKITELLNLNGINCIDACIDIEVKDETAEIKSAEVIISSNETEKAKELIKENLGIQANVRRENDDKAY